MKPFTACVFVALLSGALAAPGASEKWSNFKAKFAKSHPAHEDHVRMARFLEKDAMIEAHNARYAAGLESYSLQHSQYDDLSKEEFAKHALGFVPAVNASDIPFAQMKAMPNEPTQFSWLDQGIMTPVTDQQSCGSCYAFAGSSALEAQLKWKTGRTYQISNQRVVDCSYRKHMGGAHNGGCDGGWPTAVGEHFGQLDIMPESQYPYTSGRTQRHGTCRYPYATDNVVRGRLQMKNVRVYNENDIIPHLLSKGPLVIAIAADQQYQVFFNNLKDGVFDDDRAIGLQPNHAVVLTGYGVQNGKPYWQIKNTWGSNWGSRGYGKIRRGRNMCGIMTYGVFFYEGL